MQNETTRRIALTQGQFAIVDAVDYDWLSQWKWCARRNRKKFSVRWYAARFSFCVRKRSSVTGRFYWLSKLVYMHREIAKRANLPSSRMYDHRDGDGLNNQRSNLRPATQSQNNANSAKRKNTTSRFKGVSWHKQTGKWCAYINSRGKRICLGLFNDEGIAADAYREAAKRLFGEFAHV